MLENLEHEIETDNRKFGSGWISGVLAVLFGVVGLGTVFCFRFPELLTMPEARALYPIPLIRTILHLVLIAGFGLSCISLVLRKNKIMGSVGVVAVLLATALGGSAATPVNGVDSRLYFGLDYFFLNLLFLGFVFIPLERLFALRPQQTIFRDQWREDLLYFFIGSLFVQGLTYLSLTPAETVLKVTQWGAFRQFVAHQPVLLQFIEIMFLTDMVQYWVHRLFHKVHRLWRFHAVHHSAQSMDWIAASRMHVIEIVILRGVTVAPMLLLGFGQAAMEAYLVYVYLLSSLIHANVHWDFGWLKHLFATPQFHHWHHGIEREAIDVNFAIHFPWIDRMFGTYYMPEEWPTGYGIGGHPVPHGYLKQFEYPFLPRQPQGES